MPATWSGKGLQKPREELALPERCDTCRTKFDPFQRNVDNTPIFFGFQNRETMFPAIALAGNIALPASGRSPETVACGGAPHVRAE